MRVTLLQVRDVFADVVNGKRAKRNEVLQAFETDDLDVVSFFCVSHRVGF
jgi:ribosome maturation protein Sdo1